MTLNRSTNPKRVDLIKNLNRRRGRLLHHRLHQRQAHLLPIVLVRVQVQKVIVVVVVASRKRNTKSVNRIKKAIKNRKLNRKQNVVLVRRVIRKNVVRQDRAITININEVGIPIQRKERDVDDRRATAGGLPVTIDRVGESRPVSIRSRRLTAKDVNIRRSRNDRDIGVVRGNRINIQGINVDEFKDTTFLVLLPERETCLRENNDAISF